MTIWKKRELYEIYAGSCLSEKAYSFLEEHKVIPKNIQSFYTGKHTGARGTPAFHGYILETISESGLKLFLQDYNYYSYKCIKHCGLIFYDDFVVIVPEPSINDKSFGEIPDALPVVIPICNIERYEREIIDDHYIIKIYFVGSEHPFDAWIYGNDDNAIVNFMTSINCNICKFSPPKSFSNVWKKDNYKEITDKLDDLIENCSKDFIKRQTAVSVLFDDRNTISELSLCSYLDKNSFVDKIERKVSLISTNNFPGVVNALNELREYRLKPEEKERQSYIIERDKKEIAYKSASFFKKKKLKNEINCLTEKIEKLNVGIEKYYNQVMTEILNVAYFSPDASISEKFCVPEEYISLAKEIYLLCEKRNITKLETENELLIFSMICRKYNVPEEYQTEEFFNFGIQMIENEKQEHNERQIKLKINENRIRKTLLYHDMKDKSTICGPIKYTAETIRKIAVANKMADATELIAQLSRIHTKKQAIKSDSAILGGLASGIAGSAVGMIAYAEAEASNARAEATAAEIRESGRRNLENATKLKESYLSDAGRVGEYVAKIHERLYDTTNADKYFSYLKCEVESYIVGEDGMMSIEIIVDFAKDPKLGGLPIIIDGSFCIDIKENNKKVGDAYVCAPGFDELFLDEVGFNAEKKYTAIGMPIIYEFDPSKEYTFEFRPVNIWMIEK